MFLSKRAAKSFGGYASAQLRRLQNALARDSIPQREREQHILNSVNHALEDFQRRYDRFEQGSIRLYIGPSEKPDLETEIFVDAAYRHLPLREYETMCSIIVLAASHPYPGSYLCQLLQLPSYIMVCGLRTPEYR